MFATWELVATSTTKFQALKPCKVREAFDLRRSHQAAQIEKGAEDLKKQMEESRGEPWHMGYGRFIT